MSKKREFPSQEQLDDFAAWYDDLSHEKQADEEGVKSKFQVWVTLEKWQADNKIDDVETCLVGEVGTEEEGKQLFMASQGVSIAIKNHLEPMLETLKP